MKAYFENFISLYRRVRADESGVTVVEYAVMLFLVAIAVLLFGRGIANSVTDVFNQIATGLTQT